MNYPPVVIASNAAPSFKPEIAKRAVMCRVNSRIDRTEGIKKEKQIEDIIESSSDAFYREYIRRMLPKVAAMAARMRGEEWEAESEAGSGSDDWMPDIVLESSTVITEMLAEAADISGRPYIRPVKYSEWASEQAISRKALDRIIDAWKAEPGLFTVDRRGNRLIYAYPENAGGTYELQHLANELPASFEANKLARSLVMKLDEAEKATGIRFKKRFFLRGR